MILHHTADSKAAETQPLNHFRTNVTRSLAHWYRENVSWNRKTVWNGVWKICSQK